jgi:hypothetical protein
MEVFYMAKLTKAKKAAYPEFIARIDFCASFGTEFANGLLIKAMTETTLMDAVRRMEAAVGKLPVESVYLVDIYGKAGELESGEPLYSTVIMSRVHYEYDKLQSMQWHIRDEAHGERESGLYAWFANGDGSRYGALEFERHKV